MFQHKDSDTSKNTKATFKSCCAPHCCVRTVYNSLTSSIHHVNKSSEDDIWLPMWRGNKNNNTSSITVFVYFICRDTCHYDQTKNKHIKGIFIGETEYKFHNMQMIPKLRWKVTKIHLKKQLRPSTHSKKHQVSFFLSFFLFCFEIRALYKVWLKRQITPLGRVAVLKSLILSKIIHLWMLLPNPPDNLVNKLQKTVFQFVRNRKQDRISRKIAVRSIAKGGLGIPNIKTYINALKLIWIRKKKKKKKKKSEHKWKSIIKSTYPKVVWFEQLGSSLHFQEHEVNKFWSHIYAI